MKYKNVEILDTCPVLKLLCYLKIHKLYLSKKKKENTQVIRKPLILEFPPTSICHYFDISVSPFTFTLKSKEHL